LERTFAVDIEWNRFLKFGAAMKTIKA